MGKTKKANPSQVELVRPFVVHDFTVAICSLGTGWTMAESRKRIIEDMEKVKRKRIELLGKSFELVK